MAPCPQRPNSLVIFQALVPHFPTHSLPFSLRFPPCSSLPWCSFLYDLHPSSLLSLFFIHPEPGMCPVCHLIYKTSVTRSTDMENILMVTKGESSVGKNRSLGLTYTHYLYKTNNQLGPIYSTGNYTQYSAVTAKGKI